MVDLANSPAARDKAFLMHPYTNLEVHQTVGPMILQRAKGVYVYDDEGKAYIEGLAGLWCTALGYGEERLIEAATRQMRELPYAHLFAHKSTNPAIDLAEKLISVSPVPMSKVFFCNSGSEANDTVVKLVWYYNNAIGRPEKKKIIARLKGYHGVTVAAGSMTGLPYAHGDFDMPIANILHTDCPHYYMGAEAGESEEDFATRLADNLDKQIVAEGPETVAAFIAEPVMGAGGVIVPPATYYEKIQAVLKKHDVLLIADEVICGFGRTGNYWGSQTMGMTPDILTCAKALSSAYQPISAVLINKTISEAVAKNSGKLGTFGHGYTYTGHPVAAAVALETLRIYEEDKLIERVRDLAPVLQDGLRAYADHPIVGEVRGIGLIAAVQLMQDKASRTPFDAGKKAGQYLFERAQSHGVILRALPGDAVAFCPPYIITPDELRQVVSVFGKALEETAAYLKG
ncbi:MAG: aspartate aminotransferase family protein [Alphaproteobacteria bacterium]